MSKKSDDSIDRIFRQALTQYDTKFHEDDWVKMEKLLNDEAQRKAAARSRRIKGTAYTLTGLTGLIIAVYFLAIRNPSGSIADLRDSVTEMQASEALTENGNVTLENPSEGLLSQSSPDKIAESEITPDNTNSARKQPSKIHGATVDRAGVTETDDPSLHQNPFIGDVTPEGESPATNKLNRRETNEIKTTPSGSFRNKIEDVDKPGLDPSNESKPSLTQPDDAVNVEAVGDKFLKSDNDSGHTYPKANSGESGKATLANTNEANDGVTQQAKSTSAESLPNKTVLEDEDSSLVTAASRQKPLADSALDNTIISKEENTRLQGRLSFAFVFAPEFSTTSLSNYSSPGDSYGLRIGYQLSKRLSVQTGFIRSQKKYEGSGSDYKPRNPAYWQIRTNGVVPEEIYSKCLVYELPLGIQFDAIQTAKSRVFFSASSSSYFMISQAYDYAFQSPNPGADMGWRSRGSESYWFSVGMVSAGYERYINRSFAIGIEPYLKVSLAEIGWPKIKLYSTGAYVTLRYKFMGRKNF